MIVKKKINQNKRNEVEKQNIKEFDLSVILSFTCGYVVTSGEGLEKIAKQMELAYFLDENLLDDTYMPSKGSTEKMAEHILSLYPNLKDLKYNPSSNKTEEEWVAEQKAIFGETLPICVMGHTLDELSNNDQKQPQ